MKNAKKLRTQNHVTKLVLRRETIVRLNDAQLAEVAGGAIWSFGLTICGTGSQTC
ncbi:MAG TPA: class I lanthipeptide [Kofleriaceae bacterium]|jgi:hypothetical protein